MIPTFPVLGVLVAAVLIYRARLRRGYLPQESAAWGPQVERLILVRHRATIVLAVFAGIGISLYVWHFPQRYWAPVLGVAGFAFACRIGAEIMLSANGVDPRRLP